MLKTLRSLILLGSFIFVSTSSYAAESGAREFIENLGQSTISIVSTDSLNVEQKADELQKLFVKSVDIDWMGKFAVGRYWNDASEKQQKKYAELYKQFLINSYVPKFRTYTDEKIEVTNATKEDEVEYLIQTEIRTTGEPTIQVDYKVRQSEDGSYKIFDVVAEGVSLITTQRSDFGSILSRKGFKKLISLLEDKIDN